MNIPLPVITAQSYAIFDLKNGNLLLGRKENLRREIASLTKIMTFYTVLDLLERYRLKAENVKIKVTNAATLVTGTSACLREGDILTVYQLFYGLMLPSGNDAAYLLAEYFGEKLYQEKYQTETNDTQNGGSSVFIGSWQFPDGPIKYFLKEMNLNAAKLRMFSSNFDSPHGLINKYNYSTAYDVCLLT
jgi:D-alanyl-D-alanine carboxypeptidase